MIVSQHRKKKIQSLKNKSKTKSSPIFGQDNLHRSSFKLHFSKLIPKPSILKFLHRIFLNESSSSLINRDAINLNR